jgi:diguanylate cyclase (GGDEF)-like protein
MMSESMPRPNVRRVLIIDDSAAYRRLLESLLCAENIELVEAGDGISGLASVRQEPPDLILLDVNMPGWSGFETIRRLKDDTRTRAIPVIFMSSSCSTADKARGLDLGAVDFVDKPFDPVELRARVRVALRNKYLQDLLEQRANLDGLTGLGNRMALEERLTAEWSLCQRMGRPLSLLLADLDRFKSINDQHGHSAGDEILRRVAMALRNSVRACDFVARYGGEEFVVIAPDCGADGALSLAERFKDEVATLRVVFNERVVPVTTSVGVACAGDLALTVPSEILSQADRALYQAKAAGRNSVRAWDWPREWQRQPPLAITG